MPATVLDGNLFASQIKAELAEEIRHLAALDMRPGLAAVLVGKIPPPTPMSATRSAPASNWESTANSSLRPNRLTPNSSSPSSSSSTRATKSTASSSSSLSRPRRNQACPPRRLPGKGRRWLPSAQRRQSQHPSPGLVPCTPAGSWRSCAALQHRHRGPDAVVVGRSDIVGKPMAMLLPSTTPPSPSATPAQ